VGEGLGSRRRWGAECACCARAAAGARTKRGGAAAAALRSVITRGLLQPRPTAASWHPPRDRSRPGLGSRAEPGERTFSRYIRRWVIARISSAAPSRRESTPPYFVLQLRCSHREETPASRARASRALRRPGQCTQGLRHKAGVP